MSEVSARYRTERELTAPVPLVLTATLPLPPSINRTYKTTRSGGFYADRTVKAWGTGAVERLLYERRWPTRLAQRLGPDYRITFQWVMYCAKNRDGDSSLKLLQDTAINHALGLDDAHVDEWHGRKVYTPKRAEQRVAITVTISSEEGDASTTSRATPWKETDR